MTWVSVDDLSVGYGARAVLEGVDLAVERGSIVAVLGPSGCGKTTLLRSIAGLLRVSAGSIRIGGREALLGIGSRTTGEAQHRLGAPGSITVPASERRRQHRVWHPARLAARRSHRQFAALVGLGDHLDRSPSQVRADRRSASHSLERSRRAPMSCSSTSRSPRSTRCCAPRPCAPTFPTCSASNSRPRCSSRMIRKRRCRSPTRSP